MAEETKTSEQAATPQPKQEEKKPSCMSVFMENFWIQMDKFGQCLESIFVTHFIITHIGWSLCLICSHLLFWMYGFPTVLDYGYTDHNKGSDGNIPSGPSGSGVFPISVILVTLCSFAWTTLLITWTGHKPKVEEDE